MTKKQRRILARILITVIVLPPLLLIPTEGLLRPALFFAVYLLIGYDILRKAALGIYNRRLFDESFLMTAATIGAFALAILDRSGDYLEAIAVMLFYQIGELFQSCAVRKSRKSIGALMDIRPDHANWEADGRLLTVSPEEVPVGSVIRVNPGERIPLDGVVVEGCSALNTVALTGESLPREVAVGDAVISGCVNTDRLLRIQTTHTMSESTVSRILELVESASSRKSVSERFISKFARIYTPVVCAAALLLAVLPPLILPLLGMEAAWSAWLYRALTFLVISCPCALVISIPLTFFAGIGSAGKCGILVKGSCYLELLAKPERMVFDKTGTLTKGEFQVVGVVNNRIPAEELLAYAAIAEAASTHPIAEGLRRAYGREIDPLRITGVEELGGNGVRATVDGCEVAVGNRRLVDCEETALPQDFTGTVVYVALNGVFAGAILLSDTPKDTAADAIAALKRMGVKKTVMLTGDNRRIAAEIASSLGLDDHQSELLPNEKVEAVEALLQRAKPGGVLAFVGDGINDAPALARADVGIAMGALGSDAAIEAADVVLMNDDPMQIVHAVAIARKCLSIVRQNIIFSLAVKFACLGLVALGYANMWFGIFADVGVMVLAVLNAIRAMRH